MQRRGETGRGGGRFAALRSGRPTPWARRAAVALVALTTVAAAGVLLWLGLRAATRALVWDNACFRVREIRVECSGDVISSRHVMDYARLGDLRSLFATNIADVRAQLLAKVPRLQSVTLERRLPGDLVVRVRERLPVANMQAQQNILTLDREGMVLGPARPSRVLPLITGHFAPGIRPGVRLSAAPIRNALAVLDVCQTTPVGRQVRVAAIDVGDPEALDVRLADGERIRLAWTQMGDASAVGREQLERKMARLVEALASAKARHRRIATLDLTMENNIPAREY